MSLGLSCAVVAVMALCVPGQSLIRLWACRISITGALVLYAPVAEISVGLMNCESSQLALRLVSSLDGHAGDAAPSSSALASQLSTWNLLASDPYFVCFAGQHASPGYLAELVFAVYICALPIVSLMWLWRSIREARATGSKASSLLLDPTFAPFLSDPGHTLRFWYWRHIDLFVMFILAINQGLQPRPTAGNLIVRIRAVFTCSAHVFDARLFSRPLSCRRSKFA